MQISRLTRYLTLPLAAVPLALIAVLSLLLVFAMQASLFGLPLALLVLAWLFKYAFVLLDSTTDGVKEPPPLSIEMVNPVNELRSLVLLLIVIGIFYGSGAATYWLGPLLSTVISAAVVIVFPAIIAVQGATGSLRQSLNPHRCLRLIARLAKDYALIVCCAAVLLTLAAFVAQSASIPLLVRIAFGMYAYLAVFTVIGGVLFARRDAIGLDAAYSPEHRDETSHRDMQHERDRIMDRIYAEWRGGAHVNACKTITELLQNTADPAAELEWMYEKTAAWPDAQLPNQLAQAWLPHLLTAKRGGRILELLRERLAVDPDFRPATSNQLLRCARLARDSGERPTARMLLLGFTERYPNDTLQASVQELWGDLER